MITTEYLHYVIADKFAIFFNILYITIKEIQPIIAIGSLIENILNPNIFIKGIKI